jgi:CheY-like chemotaxis protein
VASMYKSALRRLSVSSGLSGLSVETAGDGTQALERLRADPSIDLVITDVYMPLMTGFTLLEKMRADPRTSETPVIVISGCGAGEREHLARLGADFFLEKPVNYEDIVRTVRALLSVTSRPGPANVPPAQSS